ncbi:MAG: hypothetical protein R3179_01825 [Sedimenticolaceae bacterium]|nr:hypothetical protein [Sedimenticolaceae bacterium]
MSKKKTSDASRSLLDQRLRETASEIFEDVEHAGDEMLRELREGLESISKSMSNAAKVAQETSKSVSSKVREIESKDVLLKLMDEIEEISTGLMDGVGRQFNELRERIEESGTDKAGHTARKSGRKKAVRKKSATARKKVVRKKS